MNRSCVACADITGQRLPRRGPNGQAKEEEIGKPQSNMIIGTMLIMVLLVIPSTSMSQGFDDRAATARVMTVLSVTATQDLNFGQVYAGVPKTTGNDVDDSSAVFTITGEAGAGISVQLILPEYLSLADGSDRMTVVFENNVCSIDTLGTASPSTVAGDFQNVNPRSVPAGVIVGNSGASKVFLGGKIIPSVNQKVGNYSGDIVLSVSYDGT